MQLISVLCLLPAVMAQYSSTTTSSAAASSSSAASVPGVHVVNVGQGGLLTFVPNNMTVPVGETVEFHFWPKAHSVSQSSFDAPCKPLNATSFFSGPISIASGVSPTVFSIVVNNTSPIWFYCATGSHCQSGMGGVINPPAANLTRTITNYLAGAAKQSSNVAQVAVQGGKLGTAATVSTSPSATSSPSASTTPNAANKAAASWGILGVAGLIGAAML